MGRICWLNFVWKTFWSEKSCLLSDSSSAPCEMRDYFSALCCWVQCLKEKETFKISAEVADWVFLNAVYFCIHSPQQRARMGTPRLWMCSAKPRAWQSVLQGEGWGTKLLLLGWVPDLVKFCCVPLWWQWHLLSTKLSCRQMWTFPEATFGCTECFRGKAMK